MGGTAANRSIPAASLSGMVETVMRKRQKHEKGAEGLSVRFHFCLEFTSLMKYSGRVPQSEMDRARKVRTDFLNRYDEQRLREELDEELRKPFE